MQKPSGTLAVLMLALIWPKLAALLPQYTLSAWRRLFKSRSFKSLVLMEGSLMVLGLLLAVLLPVFAKATWYWFSAALRLMRLPM